MEEPQNGLINIIIPCTNVEEYIMVITYLSDSILQI